MAIARKASLFVDQGSRRDLVSIAVLVVFVHRKEKLALRIPQLGNHRLAQTLCKGLVLLLQVGPALPSRNLRNRFGIGPHVSVETRPIARGPSQDILRLSTRYVELHAVVMSCLPKQADFCVVVPLSPTLIVGDEPIEQPCHMDRVGMHRIDSQYRIGQPRRIVPRLSPRSFKPVSRIILGDPPLAQPTGLVKLMARRATDRSVSSRPERPIDKLGKQIPSIRIPIRQMLGHQLPAVIVGRLNFLIRAIQKGNVLDEPIPIPIVEISLLSNQCSSIENRQLPTSRLLPNPLERQDYPNARCDRRMHNSGSHGNSFHDDCFSLITLYG